MGTGELSCLSLPERQSVGSFFVVVVWVVSFALDGTEGIQDGTCGINGPQSCSEQSWCI